MIKSISLTNWKTHKDTKMDFSKGTNVLVGIVGAGKSSVMDAICFALFGTFPSLNSKKISTDEVIMNSPNEMDSAKIELGFFYKNNEYKVERIVYRGKKVNEAKLYKNNEFFTGPKPSDVNEKIEELLEINFDLFSRAVYSEQNEIDYFLKLSPAKRKEKFDELLDLEKYEKARSNSVLIANRLKKNIEEKSSWIRELSQKLDEKQLLEMKNKLSAKNKEMQALSKKHSLIEDESLQLSKEIDALGKIAAEHKSLQEFILRVSGREEELKKSVKKLEEEISEKIEKYDFEFAQKMLQSLELKQKMLKEQEQRIKQAESSINSLLETKSFLERELEQKKKLLAAKSIEELNEQVNALIVKKVECSKILEKNQKNSIECSEKISSLKASMEVNESKNSELIESIKQLKVHAVCPICETELKEAKKTELLSNKQVMQRKLETESHVIKKSLEEETQKAEKAQNENASLQKNINELEMQKLELNEKSRVFSEITSLKQKIAFTETETESKQSIVKIALQEFRQEAAKEIQLEQKRFEKVIEALQKKEELSALEKQLINAEEKIKQLNFSQEYFDKLRQLHAKKASEKESNERELNSLGELINQLNKSIEGFEALKNQQQKLEEEVSSFKALHEKMLVFVNSLKSSQAELRQLLVDTVNQAMDDIWPRIYPYNDFVSAKIEILENGDYELKVKQNNGKWVRVEGILSGGERSSAAICIRIAFSLVLTQNLSWLILDEPTHNLDAKSVKELSKMMKEHLPELVEQIFVITHDSEMEKAASATLYLLERDKAVNGVTNAVQLKN